MSDPQAHPPPAPTSLPDPSDQLLSDLRLGTPQQRQKAAIGLGELGNKDEEIIITLQTVAVHDSKESVRKAAQTALAALGHGKPPPPPRPFYQQRDFWAGFVGWYVINGLAWTIVTRFPPAVGNASLCIITGANLVTLPITAFKRRWLAGGILVAIALNILIALVLGSLFNAVCGTLFGAPFFIDFGR